MQFINSGILDIYYTNPNTLENEFRPLNLDSGEPIWYWRDVMKAGEEIMLLNYQGREVYKYQNEMLYHYGPRNYCINVKNGTTVWKKNNTYQGFSSCYGFGSQYFTFGTPLELFDKGYWEQSIY